MDEDALYRLTRYLQDESQKLYDACITHQQTYIEVNDIKTDMTHIIKTLFLD